MSRSYIRENYVIVFTALLTGLLLALGTVMRGEAGIRGMLYRPDTQELYFDARVAIGVYDPQDKFASSKALAMDHVFVDWVKYDALSLKAALADSVARNRWPVVTIEPLQREGEPDGVLLERINRGAYDAYIARICTDIGTFGGPLLVRWGHEMDNLERGYPWATKDAPSFISAYRHFVTECRTFATNAEFVWSPTGNDGLARYWPGDDVVDYVGVSVFSFPKHDRDVYGKELTFEQILGPKYARVEKYKKPVIIAELGVTGDRDYQRSWLEAAFKSTTKYPLLRSMLYFNAVDSPQAWDARYLTPDWRLDNLLNLLTEERPKKN